MLLKIFYCRYAHILPNSALAGLLTSWSRGWVSSSLVVGRLAGSRVRHRDKKSMKVGGMLGMILASPLAGLLLSNYK